MYNYDNLSKYKVFLCVAECGSISQSAEQLYISQPAVSMTIKKLEESLGTTLFLRKPRGVVLTENGRLLYDGVKQALNMLSDTESNLKHLENNGRLRIAASNVLCKYLLMPYLQKFTEKYPFTDVSITCTSSANAHKMLEECKIDVALMAKPDNISGLEYYPLGEIQDTFVCTPSYLKRLNCNGFEISDDLIGGIEEALNKDRLVSAWSKVDNNLLPRAKEKAKILWCGTRWSMVDPAGLRMELLENDERFKNRRYEIINLSALDEDDESQFDYDYSVGFSTEYYRMRRASFERNNDMASWQAQYMGEPIERDGALFSPGEFRYYNGVLPDEEPDRVFMAVDPAFGGGDFVASPVCFQYGDDIYVHDVVYDSGDKRITQPLLAQAVIKYNVVAMQIEANKSTEAYKDGVQDELKKQNRRINLTTKAAPSDKAKYQRIFDKAPDIRENMIFRESGKRSKAYSLFMQNVFSYKMFAKNKNDDAPESLAMAMDMVRGSTMRTQVFKRLF